MATIVATKKITLTQIIKFNNKFKYIVFIWSQLDGRKVEQRTMA